VCNYCTPEKKMQCKAKGRKGKRVFLSTPMRAHLKEVHNKGTYNCVTGTKAYQKAYREKNKDKLNKSKKNI